MTAPDIKKLKKIIDDQPNEFFVLYTGYDDKGVFKGTYYFEMQKNRCKTALIDLLKKEKLCK